MTRFLPLLLMFLPSLLHAGDRVDESRAVPNDPVVTIENVRGDVEILGWDEAEISVSGELDDLAEAFVFEVDGRNVLIEVRMPSRDVNWGDGSDLVVRLPAASRVSFNGVSTDVSLEGITGGARLQTVSGDIDARDIEGQFIANSVSGDVTVEGATDRASLTTISGEIEFESNARRVRVDSVSGDIDIELSDFDEFSGRTVSGDFNLSGRLLRDGRLEVNSVSGDIRLDLDEPVDAELRIEAGVGGEIHNDITRDKPREIFPARQELVVTAGDGSGMIRVETVSADIRLN